MSMQIHGHRAWRWGGPGESVAGAGPAQRADGDGDDGAGRAPHAAQRADAAPVRHALWDALRAAVADLPAPAPSDAAASDAATAPAQAPDPSTPATTGAHDGPLADVRHALHDFMHALFQALRPTAGEAGAPGRHGHGFAWGRQSAAGIAQRLEALAQSLGAAGGDAPSSVDATKAAESSSSATTTPSPAAASSGGATTAPAAASPTSSLLAAFSHLMTALHASSTAQAGATGSDALALATLLHKLSQALSSAPADAAPAAGALVNVTA